MPAIKADELEGRRACSWFWYRSNRLQASTQAIRSRGQHPEWVVRLSRPRRRYGVSVGSQGSKVRKIHVVRDQIIATHSHKSEVRCTRYLCGAWTFSAVLQWETNIVCSQCHLIDSSQHLGNTVV